MGETKGSASEASRTSASEASGASASEASGASASEASGASASEASGASASEASSERPLLRVVRGDATPEEVAAVVAVFAALRSTAPPARRPVPAWGANHRQVRQALPHGPGGWRASALPR
ncbi:MAG: hypothetical protein HYU55_06010 [Nocardioides sp.]|nr:hypothetical protein [Nocardioides sp.]